MRRANQGAALRVPLSVIDGRDPDGARPPGKRAARSSNALTRTTILPVRIGRTAEAESPIAISRSNSAIDAVEGVHISEVDPGLIEGTRADVVLLDARHVRSSLTYRAIARIRGAGWTRGIVLLLEVEDLPAVPVATTVGATDFVLGSASSAELETRLRREASLRSKRPARHAASESVAGIQLRWRTHQVAFEGTTISVTLRELQLLAVFLERIGEIVTPNDLAALAWGAAKRSGGALATAYVCSLRKKLAWFGGRFGIQTIRAVGYRFVV